MTNQKILLLIIFSFLQSCQEIKEPEERNQKILSADEEVVMQKINQYYSDFSARDWDKFAGHFAPEAIITTIWIPPEDSLPRLETSTIPEFLSQTSEGPDSQPIFEEKMTDFEIKVDNNLAQVWAKYDARFGSEDQLITWSGTDAFSLLKYNGEWLIVSITFASEFNED